MTKEQNRLDSWMLVKCSLILNSFFFCLVQGGIDPLTKKIGVRQMTISNGNLPGVKTQNGWRKDSWTNLTLTSFATRLP